MLTRLPERQSLRCSACCGAQLAGAGRVVILSLHQPSAEAFALLDRALLLVNGRCAFCGPPSAAEAHLAAAKLPVPRGEATAAADTKISNFWPTPAACSGDAP